MANKRISALPNLDADNLIPSAAFIIVEQNGVTYKMPVLGFGGASAATESLLNSKSTSLYAPDQNTVTLTFPETGINNTASTWNLSLIAKNTEIGSRVQRWQLNRSEVGDKKDLEITKNAGLNFINVEGKSYPTSSNTKVKIGSFSLTAEEDPFNRNGNRYPYTRSVDYYVTINCSNSDKIVLVFSSDRRVTGHRYDNNRPNKWGWEWYSGIRADLTATIEGSMSA